MLSHPEPGPPRNTAIYEALPLDVVDLRTIHKEWLQTIFVGKGGEQTTFVDAEKTWTQILKKPCYPRSFAFTDATAAGVCWPGGACTLEF